MPVDVIARASCPKTASHPQDQVRGQAFWEARLPIYAQGRGAAEKAGGVIPRAYGQRPKAYRFAIGGPTGKPRLAGAGAQTMSKMP